MRVRNMTSPRTGQPVANQFIIEDDKGRETFQSYRTTIATIDRGPSCADVVLDTSALEYSVTTSKYLYQFLGGVTRQEVLARIERGEYRVADLNGR